MADGGFSVIDGGGNGSSGGNGLISKSLAWALHPSFADTEPLDWFAFLVLAVLAGFLWAKVVRQTLDAVAAFADAA